MHCMPCIHGRYALVKGPHKMLPVALIKTSFDPFIRDERCVGFGFKSCHVIVFYWIWILKFLLNTFHSGRLRLKSSSSHVFLHGNISTDNCARKLFKLSKRFGKSTMKKKQNIWCLQWKKTIFGVGFQVFCEWHHKWSCFRPFWPAIYGPKPKPLDGIISLKKFLLESRLKSESFDTLDD